MEKTKTQYLHNFHSLLVEAYSSMKKTGKMPDKTKGYIEGYMFSAIKLKIVNYNELQEVIDKANIAVFGKKLKDRVDLSKLRTQSEDELDRPAFIRHGKHLKID